MIPTRVFWFGAGVVSGFGGALYGYARLREVRGGLAADRLAGQLADSVVGAARTAGGTLRQAVAEGRVAMDEAEERIRSDLDRDVRGGPGLRAQ